MYHSTFIHARGRCERETAFKEIELRVDAYCTILRKSAKKRKWLKAIHTLINLPHLPNNNNTYRTPLTPHPLHFTYTKSPESRLKTPESSPGSSLCFSNRRVCNMVSRKVTIRKFKILYLRNKDITQLDTRKKLFLGLL